MMLKYLTYKMPMHRSVLFLLWLFLPLTLPAQNGSGLQEKTVSDLNGRTVADIVVMGNDHTRKQVIVRELLFNEGDAINDSLLNASKKRIENLWLFNRVELIPVPNGTDITLLISVTERLYLFPFPTLVVEDRDWSKLTYGFGIAHENFRGRNEKVFASALFGSRPGYTLSYLNPWIHDKLHFTAGFYLQKYTFGNHSYDFDENHLYMSFNFGKYWTRNAFSKLSFIRDEISVDEPFAHRMNTGNSSETNYGLGLLNLYDGRDLYAYPGTGWYTQLNIKKYGFFEEAIDYWKTTLDVRRYYTWQPFILAGRVYSIYTGGDLPVYDRVYLGFTDRIRGHFYEIREGKHSLLFNGAIRFKILPVRYVTLPQDIFPSYLTRNLKFGLNGGLFWDSGIIWNEKRQLAIDNFLSGFGVGLHFRLPYIEVLRLDLAFDEHMKAQFIVENGVAF